MQTLVKVLIGSIVVTLVTGIIAMVLASNSMNSAISSGNASIPTGALVCYVIAAVAGLVTTVSLIMWIVETIKKPSATPLLQK